MHRVHLSKSSPITSSWRIRRITKFSVSFSVVTTRTENFSPNINPECSRCENNARCIGRDINTDAPIRSNETRVQNSKSAIQI